MGCQLLLKIKINIVVKKLKKNIIKKILEGLKLKINIFL